MNTIAILQSLEIMAKGMGGIFVTILLIMLCVMAMGKLGTKKKEDDTTEGK